MSYINLDQSNLDHSSLNNNLLNNNLLDENLLDENLLDENLLDDKKGGFMYDMQIFNKVRQLNDPEHVNDFHCDNIKYHPKVSDIPILSNEESMENKMKLEKLLQNKSECAFHRPQDIGYCSPNEYINIIKNYLISKNKIDNNITDNYQIIEKAKQYTNCDSERCVYDKMGQIITRQTNMDLHTILLDVFKPEGPGHTFDLLTNYNIDEVLDQISKLYPDFLHIGFQMNDFIRVKSPLNTIDMVDVFNKYKKFGVVLNTDNSSGGGIHWYCIYGELIGELSNGVINIYYFNSVGGHTLKSAQNWICRTKHLLEREFKKQYPGFKGVNIHYENNIAIQDDEHSCGVYTIVYIICRLEGIPSNWLALKSNFNDTIMHRARPALFIKNYQ
jgi:hypothetical protein